MDDHLDRLERSAEGIFLEWDRAAFEKEIDALLEANDDGGWSLRLVITRGGRRIAMVERPRAVRARHPVAERHLPADDRPDRAQDALL